MKKLFLPLLFMIFHTGVIAQSNFSVEVPDTTLYGQATDSDFYGDVDLINNTSGTLQMTWELVNQNLPSGWEFSFCDPSACRPKGATTADFPLVVSSSSNYLNVHFYPNGTAGTGTLTVKLFETSAPNDTLLITYTGIAQGTTNITEVKESIAFSQNYPNPSNGNTNIDVSIEGNFRNASIKVYNAIGTQVESYPIISGNETIRINNQLPGGIYLYSLEVNGNVVGTKKMQILK